MNRPDPMEERPNAADWRNRAERAEAECAELRAAIERTAGPTKCDVVEVVARAIHERRSPVPWEITVQQDISFRDARAAIAALQSRPVEPVQDRHELPADVRELMIAGREVWELVEFGALPDADQTKALDRALEAFSSRVPYDDQPSEENDHPLTVVERTMIDSAWEKHKAAEPAGAEPVCAACRGHRYFVAAPSTVSDGGERLPCPVCAPAVTFGSATPSNPDRLAEALKPFARAAEWWTAFHDFQRITTLHQQRDCLEVGHLHAAKAALSATPDKLGGEEG